MMPIARNGRSGDRCGGISLQPLAFSPSPTRHVIIYTNRPEADRALALYLTAQSYHDPAVLAPPRGGLPAGAQAARVLAAPLSRVIAPKTGGPGNEEFAIDTITEDCPPDLILDKPVLEMPHVPQDYIDKGRTVPCTKSFAAAALFKTPEVDEIAVTIILPPSRAGPAGAWPTAVDASDAIAHAISTVHASPLAYDVANRKD